MTTSCSSNSSIDFGLALVGGNVTDNRRNVPRSEIPNGQNIHGHDLALMSTNTASDLGPTTGCSTQIQDYPAFFQKGIPPIDLAQFEGRTRPQTLFLGQSVVLVFVMVLFSFCALSMIDHDDDDDQLMN